MRGDGAAHVSIPRFALDFETTGLDSRRDRVLEVGLVGVRSYASLVADAPPSPPAAQAAHGITPQLARRLGKPGRTVLAELLEVLGQGPIQIVSHNVPFDRSFLEAWVEREGRALPEVEWLCTLAEARELCPDPSIAKGLGKLAARFGWHTGRLHRAHADAEVTLRLHGFLQAWRVISNELGSEPYVVYLAGPVRGDGDSRTIRYNQERMFALAQWVQGVLPKAGLLVPHGNFAFVDEAGDRGLIVRERVLEACGQLLTRCDALILCAETLSPGMVHEREVAAACGLPTFTSPGWDLPAWSAFPVAAVA